jgi:hypothetical protein
MLRRDLLRSLLALPLPGWLTQRLPRLMLREDGLEANAATIYRHSIDSVKGLHDGSSELLRQPATVAIDDSRIRALLRQAQPAVNAIRKAAALDPCDWGPGPDSAKDLCKDRLDVSVVTLIRVVCLSARLHAERHRFTEAIDDLFAALKLAHRIGTGGVLFARLLECASEVEAFRTFGQILPRFDRPAIDDLSHRLDALPLPEPASATIGPESRFILSSLRAKFMSTEPLVGAAGWAELGFNHEDAETLARSTGGETATLIAHLNSTGPVFVELARRLDLPRPVCREALDEFASSEADNHPIVAKLVELAWGIRHMVDRMLALRAMLRAAVALTRDGEDAFRRVIDPHGEGPFDVERLQNGYLIRSALHDHGKPDVTLAIGAAA